MMTGYTDPRADNKTLQAQNEQLKQTTKRHEERAHQLERCINQLNDKLNEFDQAKHMNDECDKILGIKRREELEQTSNDKMLQAENNQLIRTCSLYEEKNRTLEDALKDTNEQNENLKAKCERLEGTIEKLNFEFVAKGINKTIENNDTTLKPLVPTKQELDLSKYNEALENALIAALSYSKNS